MRKPVTIAEIFPRRKCLLVSQRGQSYDSKRRNLATYCNYASMHIRGSNPTAPTVPS